MTWKHYDRVEGNASNRLRSYLGYTAKMRWKQRNVRRPGQKDFLLLDPPKPNIEKHRWSIPKDAVTLDMAAERYIEMVVIPRTGPHSVVKYHSQAKNIVDYWGRGAKVGEIRASDISAFREFLLSEGLSSATCNSYVGFIQRVLEACVELWGVLDHAPMIKGIKVHRKQIRTLSYKDEKRLLAACELPLKRSLIFLLGTGVRKSDAMNMTWDQVEFSGHSAQRTRVRIWASKTRWEYLVPLPDHVDRMLREMKRELPDEIEHVFTYVPKSSWHKPDGTLKYKRGYPSPYRTLSRDFLAVRKVLGLLDISIHSLRHTFATRLIENNVCLQDVAALLGHKGVDTVMRYAHAAPEHFDPIMSRLDRDYREIMGREHEQSRFAGML